MNNIPLKLAEVNVLTSQANWAWPQALKDIFEPRGINLLTAASADEFINVAEHKRVHTAIIDMDSEQANGLATIRLMKRRYPLLPCILLSSSTEQALLNKALQLEVFSVIDKPVNLEILRRQLDRLFKKKYGSDIFA